MTRKEKIAVLQEAIDDFIKLDKHLMTTRDNRELMQWINDLIDIDEFIEEKCTYEETGCSDCKYTLCCPKDLVRR